jgi:plasmid stability protein
MTIVVQIRPEVEAELARRASLHGRPVEDYAAALLEEAIGAPPPQPAAKNMVELFAPLRGLNLNFDRDRDAGREIRL